MSIHVFGIRHHGPGCARSLRGALEELQPDIVLVEGPPDAQEVLPLILHEGMHPPVALLIYAVENPKQAVYYPFTHFSPEWQALRYALENKIAARFIDLPQAIMMVQTEPILNKEKASEPEGERVENGSDETEQDKPPESVPKRMRTDPLALLAEAAGYSDHELWWERQIEQRQNVADLFQGILEAMTAIRTEIGLEPEDEQEARREAYMRQSIRIAQKEGHQRIAVICGAWHAPVLVETGSSKADNALLAKLKRCKVESTWIPWTNSRLSYRSGYGAGVAAPGWYEHLWTAQNLVSVRWLTKAARLLREEGIDTSSASVIEAVRLTESLAALRDLSFPGLVEHHEAIETVLCNGNAEPLELIRTKLEIGEQMGEVPPDAPTVPLQRDLETRQRQVKLKASSEIVQKDLDLRTDLDRMRSQLLHQVRLLSINWGEPQVLRGRSSGTFHELWKIQWRVEFVIAIIEANVWGNSVIEAASAKVVKTAETTEELPALSELLDQVILAELPDAIEKVLRELQKRASVSSDVRHLMDSLPALARVARYGNVRQTNADQVIPIIYGLFERIVIGLPGACNSLDDDAARSMVNSINRVQESLNLLNREDLRLEWQGALRQLLSNESIHGLIRGRSCRLLLEQQVMDEAELQQHTRLALSTSTEASQAASWIEGVVQGSALLILHQDALWRALDGWLSELTEEVFTALLPILRRAFANFHTPERRIMGEKVRALSNAGSGQGGLRRKEAGPEIDQERASLVLPILAQVMGVKSYGH
jgi:Family of unknown function (DUF5682)